MNQPSIFLALGLAAAIASGCTRTPALPPTYERVWQPGLEPTGWNQWRGPNRDGIPPDSALIEEWPSEGPRLVWRATGIGPGFSSVALAGNRVFTMGDAGGAAQLFALDSADGKVVWFARVGSAGGKRNAGPRSTPATDGNLVFGLGQDGELVCVTAADGEERWRCNLLSDFGGELMSSWNYSESPLLDGDRLVCTPGGAEGTVLALDKTTGELLWRCTELTDAASYASLIVAEIGGVRQYIVLTGESVAGIGAADGALLWRAARPGKSAVCATPVYANGIVFVTSGYEVGCNAFRVTERGGRFEAEEIYAGKQMQNHHGGVVLVDGYVYGVGRRNLKCIELATGKTVWEDLCVAKGSIAYGGGHLFVRSERREGTVAVVRATPQGYVERGRFDQPDRSGEPTWSHPVVFDGRLYLRDDTVLLCYDVRGD